MLRVRYEGGLRLWQRPAERFSRSPQPINEYGRNHNVDVLEVNDMTAWQTEEFFRPFRVWKLLGNVNPGRRSFHFACPGLFSFGLSAL
jgi:hypothetical protein